MKRKEFSLFHTIGTELRDIRKEKAITLAEVAKKVGVTSMYISEIERNKKRPSDEVIEKLAELYGVDAYELYEGFEKIPQVIEDELLDNTDIFQVLFDIASNENVTLSGKKEFYKEVCELYNTKYRKI